ncbi:anti-phage deoxyguanosine triphosphatase [Sneathiella chinensis]|uniref:Deoxyguanosinetriphosphate triphosphohydrolase-like protein n=1 Tax=Sneathiella chinensis TaxID=349750 RepID=A0ABQ5U154_9PROT|nr:anti-phage deoxyguanosine triphosphatase [Sneathiella chinensis]GLQ05884.1 dGTPase [Sneathiella chinensis]
MGQYWEERRSGWVKQDDDVRSSWDVDYSRVVHSFSFRRLQGKTQILNLGDSDFYRTRLTHSLEVGQIASGLVQQLRHDHPDHPAFRWLPETPLIQAVSFTHDLGHPPFGHGGEVALNYCMRDHGGFEGNAQTLRILSRLERMSQDSGSDLTRRALLAVLKYPVSYSMARDIETPPSLAKSINTIRVIDRQNSVPPKCYHDDESDVVDWVLKDITSAERERFQAVARDRAGHGKSLHKSFDCTIMDLADDIAYGVHDLEDAISLGLISQEQFREGVPEKALGPFLESLTDKYPNEASHDAYEKFVSELFNKEGQRKRYIGRMVHHFITAVQIVEAEGFEESLLRYRVTMPAEQKAFLNALKGLVFKKVIKSANVQHLEFKGQTMVVSVFEAFESDPEALLPDSVFRQFQKAGDNPSRVICDYVAGMTDGFLLKTYERLFSPRMGSVFDRL